MISLTLDARGRLLSFRGVPKELIKSQDAQQPHVDVREAWKSLFEAAGLTFDDARQVTPEWTPQDYADERAAWSGKLDPQRPDLELRVEAAVFHGVPTSFQVIEPWKKSRDEFTDLGDLEIAVWMSVGLFVVILVSAVIIAWRNVRLKRGDREGARRLVVWVMAANALCWLVTSPHVLSPAQIGLTFSGIGSSLFWGALIWTLYLALEPYVRRIWPQLLISWSRLQSGQLRDPILGRDLLVGLAGGLAVFVLIGLAEAIPAWLGSVTPDFGLHQPSISNSSYLAFLSELCLMMIAVTLVFHLFFLLILRVLLRRQWLAVGVWWLFTSIVFSTPRADTIWSWTFIPIALAVMALVISRFGFLAAFVWFFRATSFISRQQPTPPAGTSATASPAP